MGCCSTKVVGFAPPDEKNDGDRESQRERNRRDYNPQDVFTHQYGAADYQHSHFRQLLNPSSSNHTDISNITEKDICDALSDKEKNEWDKFDKNLSLSEKAVYFWTSGHYKNINNAIIADNEANIKKYIPLLRCVNYYIETHPTRNEMITFRKSKLSTNQLITYETAEKGKVLRHPGYISTTKDINIVIEWKGSAIIKYIIPKNCTNACDVSQISKFAREKEVLLPAYTAVEFVSIKQPNTINSKDISSNIKLTTYQKERLQEFPLITFKVLNNIKIDEQEKKGLICHKFSETDLYDKIYYFLQGIDEKEYNDKLTVYDDYQELIDPIMLELMTGLHFVLYKAALPGGTEHFHSVQFKYHGEVQNFPANINIKQDDDIGDDDSKNDSDNKNNNDKSDDDETDERDEIQINVANGVIIGNLLFDFIRESMCDNQLLILMNKFDTLIKEAIRYCDFELTASKIVDCQFVKYNSKDLEGAIARVTKTKQLKQILATATESEFFDGAPSGMFF